MSALECDHVNPCIICCKLAGLQSSRTAKDRFVKSTACYESVKSHFATEEAAQSNQVSRIVNQMMSSVMRIPLTIVSQLQVNLEIYCCSFSP